MAPRNRNFIEGLKSESNLEQFCGKYSTQLDLVLPGPGETKKVFSFLVLMPVIKSNPTLLCLHIGILFVFLFTLLT